MDTVVSVVIDGTIIHLYDDARKSVLKKQVSCH